MPPHAVSLSNSSPSAIPAALMVSTKDHVAVFRLSFEAEHSNVLIVIVELLKGARCSVEVENIEMTLMSQASPKLNYDAQYMVSTCVGGGGGGECDVKGVCDVGGSVMWGGGG